MRQRKVLDNAICYIVDDYSYRQEVGKDLEEGNRVVIISKESDVLSFYGLILEQYGQYNLYLETDLDAVDDDYLEEVSTRDVTKEESAIYVGKPLSQMITETIEELKMDNRQKRIMSMCKEVLTHNSTIKDEAVISVLNEQLRKERAEKENLIKELEEIKVGSEEAVSSLQYIKTSINLDSFTSNTQVMYIREIEYVPYFNTCIKAYLNYLGTIKGKKAKILIFDNRLFNMTYDPEEYVKIESNDYYVSNRNQVFNNSLILSQQIFPLLVQELYKSGLDILIIVDRILNTQELVKGKNVHKYYTANSGDALRYMESLSKQDFTYITSGQLNYKKSIVLDKINQDLSTPQKQFYWFSKLINAGEDNRLVFELFDNNNAPTVKKGGR